MLQVSYIRQNAALVKERLSVRNFAQIDIVDKLTALDEELRVVKTAAEGFQASINAASKEIGALMAKGEKENAETKKQEVAALKTEMAEKSQKLA